MTAIANLLPHNWGGSRDAEGHRTYWVEWLVNCAVNDGPANVLNAVNLPIVGQQWNFAYLASTEDDLWAWCTNETTMTPTTPKETCRVWVVKNTFTTKPPDIRRCQNASIEDPLLIPPRISGDYAKYTEEAAYDRFGFPIVNSAWEQIRGPKVEFDKNRSTIKIENNYPVYLGDLVDQMIDTVNAFSIFGKPPRCVKLSKAPWSRKFYGTCYFYYTYTFEFDVNINDDGTSGWDRQFLDEGHKVLNGHWGSAVGSGCTVNITVGSGGGINTASIVSAGTGYPVNGLIQLVVGTVPTANPPTPPYGGILVGQTDASGTVTSVSVLQAGTGYSNGTIGTVTGLSWVVDNINGAPPNPRNPSNFCQYKGPHGENEPVVLNGAGLPALAVISTPPVPPTYYVSIGNLNIGHALTDLNWWVPLGQTGDIPWEADELYGVGDVVSFVSAGSEGVYVLSAPVAVGESPDDSPLWIHLPNGTQDQGNYQAMVYYDRGDIVHAAPVGPAVYGAGKILVQKYGQSDFATLGIPTSFS